MELCVTDVKSSISSDVAAARPRRLEGVEEHCLLDEMVLYALEREMAFSLNHSARAVWELCDGKRTIIEISQELGRRFDRPGSELLSDVITVVVQFCEHGLLELDEKLT